MDFDINAPTASDNAPPRYSAKQRSWRAFLVGWRRSAAYLIVFIFFLTLLLLSALLVSLYGLPESPKSISDQKGTSTTTLIFRGNCDASTRYNFWGHLAVNLIASGVLASSNFFMQVLVAPTRSDVDRAHAKGVSLEIGVQSWRNLFYIPLRNRIFWVLLAVSTIPLHLVFNSTILESRASTDFLMLMVSEGYLQGAPWNATGASGLQRGGRIPPRINDIQRSLAEDPARWEKMDMQACYSRYNDTSRALFERRDVVMVLELDTNDANNNNTGTFGWAFNNTSENSLWYFREYSRTDLWVAYLHSGKLGTTERRYGFGQDERGDINFDVSTYTVHNSGSKYPPGLRTMKSEYCLSETWTAPCRVEVDNTLLFVVVLICAVKCALCIVVLITARGPTPLITPGDAIESFITKPDATTAGMCAFRPADLDHARKGYQWIPSARPWVTESKSRRRSMFAVPRSIWIWSYMLIGGSLTVGLIFLIVSTTQQWITDSEFGHDARNRQMETARINPTKTNLIVLANTPQLILSMCYFAYNGLFTRILCAFEWDKFSIMYRSLRVTHRKGPEQRSTYRLQLPYRWSIPLLLVSAILHWLYSNSLYLTIFESHESIGVSEITGLAYSSRSIFISFFISLAVASAPLTIGFFAKLPGKMIITQNNSAIISAACHCIVVPTSSGNEMGASHKRALLTPEPLPPVPTTGTDTDYEPENRSKEDTLWDIAMGKLKWGVVSPGTWPGRTYSESEPGHLAFGGRGQNVCAVVDGSFYAGQKLADW